MTTGLGTPLASHDSVMATPSLAIYWYGPALISGGTVEEVGCKTQLSDHEGPVHSTITAQSLPVLVAFEECLNYKLMTNHNLPCLSIHVHEKKLPTHRSMQYIMHFSL